MVVVPTGNMFPAGTPVLETLTEPALSEALAEPNVPSPTNALHAVALAPVQAVTFEGGGIVGAIVSLTVIATVASALVRAAEVSSSLSLTVNLKLSGPL